MRGAAFISGSVKGQISEKCEIKIFDKVLEDIVYGKKKLSTISKYL